MKKLAFLSIAVVLASLVSCSKKDPVGPDDEYAYLQARSAKRGVAFAFDMEEDYQLLSPSTSWCYNWGVSDGKKSSEYRTANNMTYCPMMWSGVNLDGINNYVKAHPETEWLLAFNEPNLTDQANMTPSEAAAKWPDVMQAKQLTGRKLVSPAMNWGTLSGWSDGVAWLRSFFNQSGVSVNDVEAVAMHAYMSSAAAVYNDACRYKVFGKPVWITEFCNNNASTETTQQLFMSQCLHEFEQDDMIGRYAWFTPRSGKFSWTGMALLKKKAPWELTKSGLVWANISSFDKSISYEAGKRIPAAQFRACSRTSQGESTPGVVACTDVDGLVEVFDFHGKQWADYQIHANKGGEFTFAIRYATVDEGYLTLSEIKPDGSEEVLANLDTPKSGGKAKWETYTTTISLKKGDTIVRLRPAKGSHNINWIQFYK